jgi:nicotinate-nucleotide adenylyltransferase
MTRHVGLFGGTFDPPHRAHLALARLALRELALDELRWVPAGQPWQKAGQPVSPAVDREAMVRLAIRGEPRFVLERCEIERAGPSYTVDTVTALQAAETARHADVRWTLLLGADQLARLHTWHRWRALLQAVEIAVAARPGAVPQPAPEVAAALAARPPRWLPLPPDEVSSTVLRAMAAAGAPLGELVPAGVAGYIADHALYRAAAPGTTRS